MPEDRRVASGTVEVRLDDAQREARRGRRVERAAISEVTNNTFFLLGFWLATGVSVLVPGTLIDRLPGRLTVLDSPTAC